MSAVQARSAPLILSCLVIAGAAGAAEQLPELTVEAQRTSDTAPTTFHTIIRPQERGESQNTLGTLVNEAPGVIVQQLGAMGQAARSSIRGSSAEQVGVYLDGIRLNMGGIGAVDLSTLPLAGIESIEVIRGGGSAQFGSDAVGGVINLRTVAADPGKIVSAQVSGGSFTTLQAQSSLRMRDARNQLVVSAQHHYSRGDFGFQRANTSLGGTTVGGKATFTRDHNRSLAQSLLLKYDRTTEEDITLTLLNDFFFTDRQLPGLEIETTQLSPTNPLEATQRLYRNTSHLGVRFAELWSDRLALQLGVHNSIENSRFQDPSPALGVAIDQSSLNNTLNPFVALDYTVPLTTGSHVVTVRYDLQQEFFRDDVSHTRSRHALLIQDHVAIWDQRLQLLPAARVHHADPFGTDPSYRLGVIAEVHPLVSLKGNIETAQRVPSFTELYHPDQGFMRGNPDLQEEQAWHWDGGVALHHDVIDLEAVYFRQYVDNSILFVPISATTIAPINTLSVDIDGVETSATIRPLEWLTLDGNYTWLRAQFHTTRQQLPGRPRHAAHGRIAFAGRMTRRLRGEIFGTANWKSSYPINVDNTLYLSARVAVAAGTRLTFTTRQTQRYFVGAEVQDLTNVQLYDARGFPLPRRAIYFSLGGEWS